MLLNIIVGLIVIGLTVIIQGYGTMFWVTKYDRERSLLKEGTLKKRGTRLMISTAVFLILIHLIQAALWALVYMLLPGITEFETFEKSMYFSLVTFTTLGYGEITISSANRMLAGLEAINGITLIGWSTAVMFAIFQQLIKKSVKNKHVN
jgi:voltage-gated potassium channel Kch